MIIFRSLDLGITRISLPQRKSFQSIRLQALYIILGSERNMPSAPLGIGRYYAAPSPGAYGMMRHDDLESLMLKWTCEQRQWEWAAQQADNFTAHVEQFLDDFARKDILGNLARFELRFDDSKNISADKQKELMEKRWLSVNRQKELMDNIIKMASIWRIWSTKKLFYRTPDDPVNAFPIRMELEPVQAHLKLGAAVYLSKLEKEVLKGVDGYLTANSIRKEDSPHLWRAMNVAMWASLMQLVLLYRETEQLSLNQSHTYAPAMGMGKRSTSAA